MCVNVYIVISYKYFVEFMGKSFFKLFIHITGVHIQPELNTYFLRVNEIRELI